MTADEMFRELGYEKWNGKTESTYFCKRTGEWISIFDDYVAKGNRVTNMPGDYRKCEILAIAKKIKEMDILAKFSGRPEMIEAARNLCSKSKKV